MRAAILRPGGAAVRVGLGNDAFGAAWRDGGALGLDAASDLALAVATGELGEVWVNQRGSGPDSRQSLSS